MKTQEAIEQILSAIRTREDELLKTPCNPGPETCASCDELEDIRTLKRYLKKVQGRLCG